MISKCPRCNGSGEIGIRTNGTREAPGPVPEDARGWSAHECRDCGGSGELRTYPDDETEDA